MIFSFFAIVLTLVLVVGLHEAGHAIAAIFFGVKVQRVSIGFGRSLLLWQGKKGCEWVWALWPFGGYVQLLNTRISPVDEKNYPFCFDKKPVAVRILILLSGALSNLIVAFLALAFLFMLGFRQDIPVVKLVQPNSIAANAGINAKDQFIAIAGQKTPSWQEVGMQLLLNLGQKNVIVSIKGENNLAREVVLDLTKISLSSGKTTFNALGFLPDFSNQYHEVVKGVGLTQALANSCFKIVHLLGFFLLLIKQLITGAISFAILLGPIGFFMASAGSFMQGLSVFLYFIASMSLAVGLINLFPFPSLDGGSIIYALIEKIRGKAVSIAMEVLLHKLAMILFIVLLVNLLKNDLIRYLH